MTLHQIFEGQVIENPNAVALRFSDGPEITYQALNQRANQLASYLESAYQVEKSDRVLMIIPRCADQVTAILALSKLGAIYVPTDVNCPPDRVRKIIKDVEPKCMITWADVPNEEMPELSDSSDEEGSVHAEHANFLDADTEEYAHDGSSDTEVASCDLSALIKSTTLSEYPTENLNREVTSDDLLYIIYTSGTTGTPKGVPIKHGGLNYWKEIIRDKFKIDSSRRVLGYISTGFDAHIWEYLMAWAAGAALHIVSDKERLDTTALKRFIQEHQVTDATLIPATLSNMNLSEFLSEAETTLKTIYSTGEACTAEIVYACENQEVDLWNCYGPTEATFGVSVLKLKIDMLTEDGQVPIGDPENEVQVHILDEAYHPVENGEEGQLYIESPYLTPGYLNRPRETQDRFQSIDGMRLYATGDRFIRDESGVLHYLGRNSLDAQTKIRGQLVSLFEVESLLKSIEGIRNACVLVIEKNGTNFLIAYVQTNNCELTDDEVVRIKTSLSANLIPAAIPAQLLPIEKLPQTTNGKLNRERLHAFYEERQSELDKQDFIIPMENKVASIMSEVLGIEKNLDEEATFFTLGGNSLLLTMLRAKIKQEFDLLVSPSELYKMDLTVAGLAGLIHKMLWEKETHHFELIGQTNNTNGNIFMFHDITGSGTGAYGLIASELSASTGKNIYAVDARGTVSESAISRNITRLAEDYTNALEAAQKEGPYTLVGWSFGGTLAWKVAENLEARGQKVELFLIDSMSPMVYQQCENKDFAELLMHRMQKLNEVLELNMEIPCDMKLEKMPPLQQLSCLFRYLITSNQDNEAVCQKLTLIYALMLANQTYSPKKLNTNPLVIRGSETANEIKKLLPDKDELIHIHLGWSLGEQFNIFARTTVKDAEHLDFIRRPNLLSSILSGALAETTRPLDPSNSDLIRMKEDVHEIKRNMATLIQMLMKQNLQETAQVNQLPKNSDLASSVVTLFPPKVQLPTASSKEEEVVPVEESTMPS